MADPTVLRTREEDAAAKRVGSLVKNKWRLDAMLGLGGMAAVYAATHRNGQRAALKIMHIDLARDRGVVERFLREAYLANKIGHPACVKVLDDDVTEADEPFLIMELLDGETVRDWWRRTGRTVPVAQALHIAERVLDCLAACHAQGIVHRDLKPANIFLTRTGEVKLLDFGVAREQGGDRPAHGLALGTPAYMSPEQARGQINRIDGRSDVFSVGALLHALITGRRIHRGKTEKESLHLAANEPVPSVATVSPDMPLELVRLIDRALAWEPRDRYRDAREMQSAVLAATASASRVSDRPGPQDSIVDAEAADLTPVQEVVEAADPRVREIAAWLALMEEAIRAGLGASWTDVAADAAMRRAIDALADIHRRRHAAVVLEVRPHALATFEHVVWAPEAALEPLTHRLFECGVRWLRFVEGITLEELRAVLSAWAGEVSAGRDPGIALWEAPLAHVRVEACLVAVEGEVDAREAFFTESLRIEGEAGRRCHAARGSGAAWGDEPSPLAPDEVIRAVYATQLEGDPWVERYAEVVAEGLVDAAKTGEVPTVLGALRRTAVELYDRGRLADGIQLRKAASDRLARLVGPKDAPKLEAAVTSAMFAREAFAAMLRALPSRPGLMADVEPLLRRVSQAEVPAILAAFRRPMPEPVKVVLEPLLARLGGEDVGRAAAANVPPSVAPTAVDLRRAEGAGEADARVVIALARTLHLAEAKPDAAEITAASELAEAVRAHPDAAAGALEVFVARRAALVNGRLLRGGVAAHEAATSVGLMLAQLGAAALTLDGALDVEDAAALISAARATLRKASASFACSSPRVRMRHSHDLLRVRGLEVERLPLEPRVIRTYAAAVVALRRHFAQVGSRHYDTPPALVRIAQVMAELAGAPPWLVSSAVDCAPDGDEAARAASAAFLAATMAGTLTDNRVQIARIALAAMTQGAARARASDAEKHALVAAAAAVLAAQGRGSPSMLAHSVICFEATWMGQGAGPVYRGARQPTLHARLVATARAYCDAMCERSGPLLPNPETVVAAMADRAETTPERTALRLLVATLGFVPAGTVAKLSSGEVAEVVASNRGTSRGPVARLVLDESGEEYSEPFEVELALTGDDGLRIAKIVSVDNWRKGPPAATEQSARPPLVAPGPGAPLIATQTATASRPPQTGAFARDDSHPGDGGSEQRLRSHAPGPSGPEATARGELATTPLVHVLVYALDHGLTGTLELQEPDGPRHMVRLVRGAPVRLRTGTEVARMENLVNLGPATRYAFYRDVDLAPEADDVPDADPLAAILAATRAWTDRARVARTLERAASLPLALHRESMLDLAGLTPEEHAVLDALRERPATLAEVIVRTGVPVDVVETLMFVALVTRQVVVPGQAKGPMGLRAGSVPPPPAGG